MGRHSPAVAELDRAETGWLRDYARKLLAELDTACLPDPPGITDAEPFSIWQWAGRASVILAELGRG